MYVDSNLLVLLVVGLLDRDLVARHRRTRQFTAEDCDLLIRMVVDAETLSVTPSTLTGASNLLRYHDEPQRSQLAVLVRGDFDSRVSRSKRITSVAMDR